MKVFVLPRKEDPDQARRGYRSLDVVRLGQKCTSLTLLVKIDEIPQSSIAPGHVLVTVPQIGHTFIFHFRIASACENLLAVP